MYADFNEILNWFLSNNQLRKKEQPDEMQAMLSKSGNLRDTAAQGGRNCYEKIIKADAFG